VRDTRRLSLWVPDDTHLLVLRLFKETALVLYNHGSGKAWGKKKIQRTSQRTVNSFMKTAGSH
jgi:hypothetical protein